ncbi:MAG: DUF2911 domain-containing protein [Acidobacteria bacterium]|nr:DUF2911 domain-containing protein [Acidobacteriota bacterium]MCA1636763.1 DUF2911 domain-containing protein [Acidobacteriota bacterium]
MKKTFYLVGILTLLFVSNAFGQLNLPRESQRAEVSQTVGDTRISLVYHRPNTKARKVWGELVPFGKVWRSGANEATVFEISRDVTVNGKPLPAGKYSLHTIPNKDEWTIIFNKTWNQWGSFNYDEKQDALRITVKPEKTDFQETLSYNFENVTANAAQVAIVWEKVKVPFTVNVGDVSGRALTDIREAMKNLKADDFRTPSQAANWVLAMKMPAYYGEALGWIDTSIKIRENFGNLSTKARLLAESGRKQDAIVVAEKAIQIGKAATPPANTADLEKLVSEWKAGK